MNKYKHILFLFGIFFFANNYAQLNNFDLSKYKRPDLERRALEFNFDVSGNNSFNEISNKYPNNDYFETHRNYYYGDIQVNYSHFLNNVKYQRSSNFGLNFSSDITNGKSEIYGNESEEKRRNLNPSISFQRVNRKYFKDQYFFETNIDLSYQYYRYYSYNYSNYETNEKEHSLIAYFPLKIGKGRIEPVKDARLAVYILQELSEVDRVTPDKTDQEIIEVAELVSKLKNRRFFDSRLRRIEEIETVDSLLSNKGYLLNSDATYFTALTDIWDYGYGQYRESGTKLSFALYPGYNYYSYKYKYNDQSGAGDDYFAHTFPISGGVEFIRRKPINLYWQNDINLSTYFFTILSDVTREVEDDNAKIKTPGVEFNFNHSIAFYPNTRTDIHFGYSLKYINFFNASEDKEDVLEIGRSVVGASTNLNINYYISPRFRISANYRFNFNWQNLESNIYMDLSYFSSNNFSFRNFSGISDFDLSKSKRKYIYNSFSIKLIYSIF